MTKETKEALFNAIKNAYKEAIVEDYNDVAEDDDEVTDISSYIKFYDVKDFTSDTSETIENSLDLEHTLYNAKMKAIEELEETMA